MPFREWLVLACLLLSACSNNNRATDTTGRAGSPCHPNGTCDPGLQCNGGICVLASMTADAGGNAPDAMMAASDATSSDMGIPTDGGIEDASTLDATSVDAMSSDASARD